MEVFSPAASPRCAELCQLLEPAEGITHMLRICRPCRCVTAAADISLLKSPPDLSDPIPSFGAGGGNRTPNLLITNQLLYR